MKYLFNSRKKERNKRKGKVKVERRKGQGKEKPHRRDRHTYMHTVCQRDSFNLEATCLQPHFCKLLKGIILESHW
jgi:hypothetical protein